MHRINFRYLNFLLYLAIMMSRTSVVCKPTDNRHRIGRNHEEVSVNDMDSPSEEPPPVRLDTLIKATEAVQKFQKLLNEQVLTVESDETLETNTHSPLLPPLFIPETTSESQPTIETTTVDPNLHKHRHSKSHHNYHHRKKELSDVNGNNIGPTPSFIADQSFDDGHRETERRFDSAARFASSPYECPRINGKVTQLLCPTRRRHGYHVCIDETSLCNGHNECPNGEDENPVNCMFYKMTMRYFKTVIDQVVELSELILQNTRRRNMEEL